MEDLKCTIVITGKQNDQGVHVEFEFDPPAKGRLYDGSGVASIVNRIMSTVTSAVDGEDDGDGE